MATPRNSTYVWVTWLAKMMAGQQICDFASWFKSHHTYDKLPSNFDIARWTVDHTRLLHELRIERRQAGDIVLVENANSYRYEPCPGVVLAGQPDMATIAASGGTVYDAKTGRPKTSDLVEVLIHMYVLPLALERHRGVRFDGAVVYPDHRVRVPACAVSVGFVGNFEYFLGIVSSTVAPPKSPSESECRFCDISSSDCPERCDASLPLLKIA